MKNLILSILSLCFLTFSLSAQEWNGTNSDIIFAENAANELSPIRIGIGINRPTEQLHTTEGVRFSGLPTQTVSPRFLVGSNALGVLTKFPSSTLSGWKLTGNTIGNSEFIGTTNEQAFKIRTNNTERVRIHADGRLGIGVTPDEVRMITDIRFQEDRSYQTSLTANGLWSESNGLFIYNNLDSSTPNRASSITLGTRDNVQARLSIAKINAVATDIGEAAITFQTENSGNSNDAIHERVRITASGTLEVNVQNNSDNNLAMHTLGDVRMDNLSSGTGQIMVYNSARNRIELSSTVSSSNSDLDDAKDEEIKLLEERIQNLENSLDELVDLLSKSNSEKISTSVKGLDKLSVHPNPAKNETTIGYSIANTFDSARLIVTSLNGSMIESFEVHENEGEFRLDLSDFADGLYTYNLIVDNKVSKSKKLIVTKH